LNKQYLHRLIQLTDKFNFDFLQLKRFIAQNSNIKIVSIFLQQTCSVKYYSIFSNISISFVIQICNIFRNIIFEKVFRIIDIEFTLYKKSATEYQYGKLYKTSYLFIKNWFFLSDIYKIKLSEILYFTVNCNIFCIFFEFSISVDLNTAQNNSAVLDFRSKIFDFLFYYFLQVIKSIKRSAKRRRSVIRNNENKPANNLLDITDKIAFEKSINIDLLEKEIANIVNQSIANRNSNKVQIIDSSRDNTYYNNNNKIREFFPPLQVCKYFLSLQVRKSFLLSQVYESFLSQLCKFFLLLQICKSSLLQEISRLNLSSFSEYFNLLIYSVLDAKNLVAEYKTNIAYSNLFFVDVEDTKYRVFNYQKSDFLKNIYIYVDNYIESCVLVIFSQSQNV